MNALIAILAFFTTINFAVIIGVCMRLNTPRVFKLDWIDDSTVTAVDVTE